MNTPRILKLMLYSTLVFQFQIEIFLHICEYVLLQYSKCNVLMCRDVSRV